jgi:hypothetical protein
MSEDHAKREIVTGDKPAGSGKTPSSQCINYVLILSIT